MTPADAYLVEWRARHPWATCSARVAGMLAELEALYGCRCYRPRAEAARSAPIRASGETA